jgi:hypothetical protein
MALDMVKKPHTPLLYCSRSREQFGTMCKIRGAEAIGRNAVPSGVRRLHVYISKEHPHGWITILLHKEDDRLLVVVIYIQDICIYN